MAIFPTTPPRRRPVTLRHVAKDVGVGVTTVSDILNRNGASRYSHETVRRVHEAVARLGYAPKRAAQQLARGRSGQIGLMLTRDLSNPFFARVADVVERETRHMGFQLQLAVTGGDPQHEASALRRMLADAVEGMILGPVYEMRDLESHRALLGGQIPTVLFGSELGSEFDEATLDQQTGYRLAIHHLLAMGHTRIGWLCAPTSATQPLGPNLDHRALPILQELGLFRPNWFEWQADTGRFSDFYAACLRFARRWKAAPPAERPTAVVCHNDQTAMTALCAFAAEGLNVPGDVSMVGNDNLPESAFLVPPLTTVDNRVSEQMSVAVRMLIHRLREPEGQRRTEVIRPHLVTRNSVRSVGPALQSAIGKVGDGVGHASGEAGDAVAAGEDDRLTTGVHASSSSERSEKFISSWPDGAYSGITGRIGW